MSIPNAYRAALDTWASWVEENINTNRTRVFFRTFEPSHWRYLLILEQNVLFISIFIFPFFTMLGMLFITGENMDFLSF